MRVALLLRTTFLFVQVLHILCDVRDLNEMVLFFPGALRNEDTAVLHVAIARSSEVMHTMQ